MNKLKRYNGCKVQESCEQCAHQRFCADWVRFVEAHKDCKGYAHFDRRVSLERDSIRTYVLNPGKVAVHSFYPFIHFEHKQVKYKKGKTRAEKKIKRRQLYYCCHLDRCVYQRYAFLLNEKYQEWVHSHHFGSAAVAYRSDLGKNNIQLAKEAFDEIQKCSSCFIMVSDFQDFFDNLDHTYLKKMICRILGVLSLPPDYYAVFKNVTKYAYWDWEKLVQAAGKAINTPGVRTELNHQKQILTKKQFLAHKNDIQKNTSGKGIPQGAPISAVLANIYMIEFDEMLNCYAEAHGGKYMRYSDDMFIAIPYTDEHEIQTYEEDIASFVEKMDGKVIVQQEKTKQYLYHDGYIRKIGDVQKPSENQISYLGFILKENHQVVMRPRAITKYYYRMRRKAYTVGKNHWKSPKGRPIWAKKLYMTYSSPAEQTGIRENHTFIDYARKAQNLLQMENDFEVKALIQWHKQKIALAIKKGMKEI